MRATKYTSYLVISLWFLPIQLFSQDAVEPTGSGTSGSPYLITNWENLYWISQNSSKWDAYFSQTEDIVFPEGIAGWDGDQGWSPIGNSVTTFTGQYDGQGFSISGLFINREETGHIGLFGHLGEGVGADQPAVIKNVRLINPKVTGNRATGSLVGRVTGNAFTLIEGCSVDGGGDGFVSGTSATGGLVGSNNSHQATPGGEDNPVISQSYANITVRGRDRSDPSGTPHEKFGGLVGCNQKGNTIDSYARGQVEIVGNGTFERIGGLAGCTELRGRVYNSYSTGNVTAAEASKVGGLVGFLGTGAAPNRGTIHDSYWDTETSGQSSSAGGAGLTTSDMKDQNQLVGLNFENIWKIDLEENDGYASLQTLKPLTYNVWTGETSEEWNNAGNWSKTRTPDATDIVVIPATVKKPKVNNTITVDAKILNIKEGASVTITPSGKLMVKGSLSNAKGENAGIVIQSDVTGTGSLIHNTEALDATVQKYLSATSGWPKNDDPAWHWISPAASGSPVANFIDGLGADYDLYRWSEAYDLWVNHKSVAEPIFDRTNFKLGEGYIFAAPDIGTYTFTGELFVDNMVWDDLTRQGSSSAVYEPGWNLIGNLYTSGITVALAYLDSPGSNVELTPKWYDESAASYKAYKEGSVIPSMTAFFVQVKAEHTTGTLILSKDARTHDEGSKKYSSEEIYIILAASPTQGSTRQLSYLRHASDVTADFDHRYDASFGPGQAPVLYSLKQSHKLLVQGIPDMDKEMAIPFFFQPNHEGPEFSIMLERNIGNTELYLVDKLLGVSHALSDGDPYTFASHDQDGSQRFELRFSEPDPTNIEQAVVEDLVNVFMTDNILHVNFLEPSGACRLEIIDLAGRVLLSRDLGNTLHHQQALHLPMGIYVVRLQMPNAVHTEKIAVGQ